MRLAQQILENELNIFNKKMEAYISSPISLLDYVMRYIIRRKGKQLRPLLVLLSAKMYGEISDTIYRAAACVEILHTATLVHDDVVDNAMERRGFFSINALWKNKVAILAGDYLLSKGMLLALEHKEFTTLEILSHAVKKMSEAELLQLEKARNFSATEEIYFDIIKGKTASLIAAACMLGVQEQATQQPQLLQQMYALGESLGIAFQIKDDILDYSVNWIGKPKGQDIADKKLTLPLIYTLEKISPKEKKAVVEKIKNKRKTQQDIKYIIELCHQSGGIDAAHQTMLSYAEKSKQIVLQFPPSLTRNAFEQVIQAMTERKL